MSVEDNFYSYNTDELIECLLVNTPKLSEQLFIRVALDKCSCTYFNMFVYLGTIGKFLNLRWGNETLYFFITEVFKIKLTWLIKYAIPLSSFAKYIKRMKQINLDRKDVLFSFFIRPPVNTLRKKSK